MNISVVVPSYNREKTITRCIKSIAGQSLPPYEIIVVDDGSTDRTLMILDNMPYDNLRVIRQNHRGAQAARNLGIINARGEYITFLDSDDEWLPDMLAETVDCFLKEGCDSVIYADCYRSDGHKKTIWRLPDCTASSYASLLKYSGPMFQSLLVKKEWLLEIGLLDENIPAYQEWDTAIRLAKKHKFVHIKKPMFIYYLHNGETISKDKKKDIAGYGYIVHKHRKEILNIHGITQLNRHYKKLIKKCLQNKSKMMWITLAQMWKANIKYMFENMIQKKFCWDRRKAR